MDRNSCLGVILAGGRSTRMGRDKALLRLGEQRLITCVVQRLQGQIRNVIINSSSHAPAFIETGQPLVSDLPDIAGNGPLSGIFSAMDHAQKAGYRAVITVAVDTPFFPADYVRQMMLKASEHKGRPVLAATRTSRHPAFGLWPLSLKDRLEQHLHTAAEKSIATFARQNNGQIVLFTRSPSRDIDPFFNINTPDDLSRAKTLVTQMKERQA